MVDTVVDTGSARGVDTESLAERTQAASSGVVAVPAREVLEWWEEIRPRLEVVLATGPEAGFSSEDILTEIQMRNMQLWVVPGEAMAITSINLYPQYKTVLILWMQGEGLFKWGHELLGEIESWARQVGAKYTEAYGRKGWSRLGKLRDYEQSHVVMRKELNG